MNNLFKHIDANTIQKTGLFLALMAALYIIFKITTNDISHLSNSIIEHDEKTAKLQERTAEVLQNLSEAIKINSKVMESVLRIK